MDDQPRSSFLTRFFRFIRRFFVLIVIIIELALLGLAFEVGRYSIYAAHPELSSSEQVSKVLSKVGKLIQLPNETPTMAAINDAASAKRAQPFLASAQNGDILIVYPNAAEAILYRPSTNRLIAVGPVNNGAGAPNVQTPTPQLSATTSDETSTTSKKSK